MAIFMCNCTTAKIQADSYAPCDSDESYIGMVLDTFEENGYDDSDFVALVWDNDSGTTRKVCYASTRSWTYHNLAVVDATPEVLEKALRQYRDAWIVKAIAETDADARKPRRGATVTIARGRRDVGTTGEVRWTGPGKYGPRVGIAVDGRKGYVFTSESNVDVIDPAPVDEQEIRDHAVKINPGWKAVQHIAA